MCTFLDALHYRIILGHIQKMILPLYDPTTDWCTLFMILEFMYRVLLCACLFVGEAFAAEEAEFKLRPLDHDSVSAEVWVNPNIYDHKATIRQRFDEAGMITIDNFLVDAQAEELAWFFTERMDEVALKNVDESLLCHFYVSTIGRLLASSPKLLSRLILISFV